MKITIQLENHVATVESKAERIDKVLQDVMGCLMAVGFYPETVYQAIVNEAYEIEENRKTGERA